jgi:hypothetical protein
LEPHHPHALPILIDGRGGASIFNQCVLLSAARPTTEFANNLKSLIFQPQKISAKKPQSSARQRSPVGCIACRKLLESLTKSKQQTNGAHGKKIQQSLA